MKLFTTLFVSVMVFFLFIAQPVSAQQDEDKSPKKLNMEKLRKDLKKMRIELSENVDNIKMEIDLGDLHNEITEAMAELKVNMKDMHFSWGDEEFDSDELQEKISGAMENLKFEMDTVLNIDIDLEGLGKALDELDGQLEGMGDKINDVIDRYREMRKEMDQELYEDGYIEDPDQTYDIDIEEDEIRVNGKILPEEHEEKYRNLIEKYFEEGLVWDCKDNEK